MGGSKNKEEQITIFLISIAEEYSRQNTNIILVTNDEMFYENCSRLTLDLYFCIIYLNIEKVRQKEWSGVFNFIGK